MYRNCVFCIYNAQYTKSIVIVKFLQTISMGIAFHSLVQLPLKLSQF